MTKIIRNPSVVSGGVVFTSAINISIVANTNNLTIADINSSVIVRATSTGNYTITGLSNPDSLGQQIFIFNVGSNNITLKNNDAGSLASARFILGTDKNIQPDEGISLVYDVASLRWRAYGVNL